MSHTVTVTRLPDETSDDVEYTIGGEHDYSCQTFRDCRKDWHRHPKNESELIETWSTKRVPEEHEWVEGEWMVRESEGCGFDYAFASDNPEWQMLALGTYDVRVSWDGDWWIAALTLRTASPDTETGGQ